MEHSGRSLRKDTHMASVATAPSSSGVHSEDQNAAERVRRSSKRASQADGAFGTAAVNGGGTSTLLRIGEGTTTAALLELMRADPVVPVTSASGSEDDDGLDKENQAARGSRKTQPKRPTKKRKATHTIRNEEIAALSSEIAYLSKRLAFVRGQAMEAASSEDTTEHPDEVEHPHVPNSLLREAVQDQQLWLARARSMVAEYTVNDFVMPAHCYIHLTRSLADRERNLRSIKLQQIRLARRYMLERSRCMDVTKPYGDGCRYVNHSGDTCSIRFSVLQLPGSLSVRQVYDVALFFTENLEISFTDGAGIVTIRENDDSDSSDPTISQHRYLTTITSETLVEGNLMLFTHFDEEDDYGIVTTTFVDRDDLHPYRGKERIRQDITAVLLITREYDQIIIRRLGHVHVHRNESFPVSDDMMRILMLGATRWGDALVKHAKDCYGL